MAYTNQTTNYGLPLPVDSDRSTFLDTNTAFAAVDTALKGAVDGVASAASDITALTTRVSSAESAITALTTRVAALETAIASFDLENAVFYDATNGTGLTNAQAVKLKLHS